MDETVEKNLIYFVVLASFSIALFAGHISVDLIDMASHGFYGYDLWRYLFEGIAFAEHVPEGAQVFLLIRLPRIIGAFLAGVGLTLAGIVFQGIFRNPLVSPNILGVSSGCTFGAALGLIIGQGSWLMVQSLSLMFGMLAVFFVLFFASRFHQRSLLIMILIGMIVGSLFTSGLSILKSIADPLDQLPSITFWIMGSLSSLYWGNLWQIAIPVCVGFVLVYLLRYPLNILSLGQDHGRLLGLNVSVLRVMFLVLSSCIVAAIVSVTGQIGWISLVVPHMVRTYIGPDHRILVPLGVIAGGAFLLICDGLARSLMTSEIPLGVISSLIGAPIFAFLLLKYTLKKHDYS